MFTDRIILNIFSGSHGFKEQSQKVASRSRFLFLLETSRLLGKPCRRYKKFFIVMFLLVGIPVDLFPNVSRTFNDSLPFISSGNYAWSTWDYLTNPYIYYLQKDDSISAIITTPFDLTQGDYLIASRFSILDFPIFLSFGINNISKSGDNFEIENPKSGVEFSSQTEERVRVLLGTHFGAELWNLGIGVFVFHYKKFSEVLDRNKKRTFENYNQVSSGRERTPSKFGIELGQKLAGRVNPAWTLSMEYRRWRGRKEEIDESDLSKRISFIGSPFLKASPSDFHDEKVMENGQGLIRDEVAAYFLGWWPIPVGDSADVGLDFNFYLPFGSGKSTKSIPSDRLLPGVEEGQTYEGIENRTDDFVNNFYPNITLDGYGVDITLFYDQDFVLFNSSSIRFSPMIRYYRFKEELVEGSLAADPNFQAGDTIFFFEEKLTFGIAFKIALNLTKSKDITLYLGWLPVINLYAKGVYGSDIVEDERRVKNTKVPILSFNSVDNYFIGMTYRFSKSLQLHFRGLSRGEVDQGKLSITSFDIGLDFIFSTNDADYSD